MKLVKKNILLILFLIVVLVCVILLFFSRKKQTSFINDRSGEYTKETSSVFSSVLTGDVYFPKDATYNAGYLNKWQFSSFYPVITSFVGDDNEGYILVEYVNARSEHKKVRLLVTGIFEGMTTARTAIPYYTDIKSDNSNKVTFSQLKSFLKVGDRIRVNYLYSFPSDKIYAKGCLDKNVAQYFEQICAVTLIYKNYSKDVHDANYASSNFDEGSYIPEGFSLYPISLAKASI